MKKQTKESSKQSTERGIERTFSSFQKTNHKFISKLKSKLNFEDLNDVLAARAIQEGHTEAFSQIIDRYKPWLIQKIIVMVGRMDITEDCVSDILTKVYISIHNWKQTHTLNSWISFLA